MLRPMLHDHHRLKQIRKKYQLDFWILMTSALLDWQSVKQAFLFTTGASSSADSSVLTQSGKWGVDARNSYSNVFLPESATHPAAENGTVPHPKRRKRHITRAHKRVNSAETQMRHTHPHYIHATCYIHGHWILQLQVCKLTVTIFLCDLIQELNRTMEDLFFFFFTDQCGLERTSCSLKLLFSN